MAKMWYYSVKDEQREGPVNWERLCRLAREGVIMPNHLVWQEGTPDWKKAKQVPRLFEEGGSAAVRADEPLARTKPSKPLDNLDDDKPRKKPARDDFDDEDDRPLRRKRRKEKSSSNRGLIIGLAAGGGGLVLIAVVVIIIVASSGGRAPDKAKAPAEGPLALKPVGPGPGPLVPVGPGPGPGVFPIGGVVDTFTFDNLAPGETRTRNVFLKGGRNVEITVDTTTLGFQIPDVDLFVVDEADNEIAGDDRISKDCFVRLVVPRDGNYIIEVVNLGPGNARSKVTIR